MVLCVERGEDSEAEAAAGAGVVAPSSSLASMK